MSYGSAISCGLTRNKKKVEVIEQHEVVVAENIREDYKVSAQVVLPGEEITVDVNVPSEEPVEITENTQIIQEPETQAPDAPDTNEADIVESKNEEPVEEFKEDNVEQVQEANDTQKIKEENVETQETQAEAEALKKPRGRAKKA